VQSALPAPLYLPAWHAVYTLPPVHLDPAGHCEHELWVLVVPPTVYDPLAHSEQTLAPVPEKRLSTPQFRQLGLPPGLYFPGVQVADVLLPSQARPAGHATQVVRVKPSVLPPEVIDPAAQSEHAVAPLALNFLSVPHFVHVALPAALNEPAGQATGSPSPLHVIPASHLTQP